jgi:hypothetical protein
MDCKRCGGAMMAKTIIHLRRRLIGFRETRFAGAYCATCQVGVPGEGGRSVSDRPVLGRLARVIRRPWPAWWHPAVARSRFTRGHGNRLRRSTAPMAI